jgi:pyruvate,water dikinase
LTSALLTPLADSTDPARFGGKAAQLAAALGNGLPVPGGVALDWRATRAVATQDPAAHEAVRSADLGPGPWAVRSSAIGEDSAAASFAGAHLTVLGLVGADTVLDAVRRVHESATEPAALAYRDRLGLDEVPRMAVVIQAMVGAEVAGVLFTRNPVTGAAERVIEASWGLGEAVVAGLVTPDQYRLDGDGRLLDCIAGEKDLALVLRPDGTVEEVPVAAHRVTLPCLGASELDALHRLASACDLAYGGDEHDIEFAFADGALFLLQRRPITHG